MAIRRWIFQSIALALILTSFSAAQTVSVPLTHRAYDAVERWEVRGLLNGVFNNTRPFTRREMAKYVQEMWEQYRKRPQEFTRVDVEQLRYLTLEFKEELKDLPPENNLREWHPRLYSWFRYPPFRYFRKWIYTNQRNFLSLQHGEFSLYGDPILNMSSEQRVDAEKGRYRLSRISNGILFRGHLGKYFGFYFNLTDNHLQDERWKNRRMEDQVLEESGWAFITIKDNGKFDVDENIAFLTFTHKYFYLLYGREYNQWGVGHRGNLILSTNAQPYDQIKLVIRYWRFKYTHLTAFLQYISPEMRHIIKSQPHLSVYWSGNRLELDAGRGIQLGFSEGIIYGNRSLQIGYLHPLSFYKSLEHYYGDRDNGVLSLDFEWRLVPGVKLFGEWFMDDITTGKLGTDFYGNKFAWQGGLMLVNPLHLPDIDFLIEYTRIKPYVYSHSFRDYNKYKHYDTILGHDIGPNSDDWFVRLRKRFSRFLQFSLEYERYRHGSNLPDRNVGGDPDRPFRNGDSREAPFLDGIRNTQTSYGGGVQYELVRNLMADFHYRRFRMNSGKWESLVNLRLSLNFGYRKENFKNVFPLTE